MGKPKTKKAKSAERQAVTRKGLLAAPKESYLQAMVSLLFGLLLYAALAKVVFPVPDVVLPVAMGFFIGWQLKRYPGIAAVTGLACGALSLLVFGMPSFSEAVPEPGLADDALHQYVSALWLGAYSVLTGTMAWIFATAMERVKRDVAIAFVVLALIMVNVAYVPLTNNQPHNQGIYRVLAQEPPAEEYRFDGFIYLKTFFLMENGAGYYDAMSRAYVMDTRMDTTPSEVPAYRLPTLFYIWKLLAPANAVFINYLFMLLSMVALAASFAIAARFAKPAFALLAPVLLSNYLIFGSTTLWFTFAEYWGFFAAFTGIAILLYEDRLPSYAKYIGMSLLFLAVAIRELFILLPLAGLVASIGLKRWRHAGLWSLPAVGFIALYIGHYLRAAPLVGKSDVEAAFWLSSTPDFQYILKTLLFGSAMSMTPAIAMGSVAVLALLGLSVIKEARAMVLLAGAALIPVAVFLFIHSGEYWGIVYVPFIFTLAPLGLQAMSAVEAGGAPYGRPR